LLSSVSDAEDDDDDDDDDANNNEDDDDNVVDGLFQGVGVFGLAPFDLLSFWFRFFLALPSRLGCGIDGGEVPVWSA
jgi:hypothetical protein